MVGLHGFGLCQQAHTHTHTPETNACKHGFSQKKKKKPSYVFVCIACATRGNLIEALRRAQSAYRANFEYNLLNKKVLVKITRCCCLIFSAHFVLPPMHRFDSIQILNYTDDGNLQQFLPIHLRVYIAKNKSKSKRIINNIVIKRLIKFVIKVTSSWII